MNLSFTIGIYPATGENQFIEKEVELNSPNLEEIKALFNLADDHEFSDMYPISKEQSFYFAKNFKVEFDFDKYQYFFEAHL